MRRILSLLPILALLAACGAEEAPPAPPPPEVGVITVQPSTVPLRKELVGRLAPVRSADVRARVPGVLQRRVYEEGSDVEEGDVLFLIDPAPLRATLASAEAALAQAQANAANAVAAANRARQLAPTEFISRSDLDNALAAERSTQAAAQAARASVESARINLGYATVRAPISGRAGKQQVTEGALVGEGSSTLLTTVDQIDTLYVNFSMGVSEFAQVRSQQGDGSAERAVQVVLQDGSTYEHPGVLDFSGDVVDPATGAVSLRARIPNPDQRLLPGTYVTVNATLGELPGAFVVPQAAVLRDARGAYALVVGADGKVVRKDVVTERAEDGRWILGGGLAAGDRVIVSGLQKAQPGAPVNAVAWTPPAAGGNGPPAASGGAPRGAVEAQATTAQPEPAAAEAAAAPADAGAAQPATQD
jgi:membrane fusion protein, multidrug efflux system